MSTAASVPGMWAAGGEVLVYYRRPVLTEAILRASNKFYLAARSGRLPAVRKAAQDLLVATLVDWDLKANGRDIPVGKGAKMLPFEAVVDLATQVITEFPS